MQDKNFENPAEMLEAEMKAEAEARRAQLYRRKLPQELNLSAALEEMTKAELDDIRYNLNVSGTSSLKKAELIERLVPEITAFARRWLPSALVEQRQCFEHLLEQGGLSTELRDDDLRLDYLRGIGLLACGVEKESEKLAWYLPTELQEEIKKISGGAYNSMTELNTEMARLAAGLLFYYGYLNFEQLYEMVLGYLDQAAAAEVTFQDFVGVMLNASCWLPQIDALPQGMRYYALLDAEKLEDEQHSREALGFAPLAYDKIYEAGEENYIESTDEYRAFAQYLMKEFKLQVLQAADIVGEIYILLQNGGDLNEAAAYLSSLGLMKDEEKSKALFMLMAAFNNSTRMWLLKGYTPDELSANEDGARNMGKVIPFGRHEQKAGRNDPCPCGSGKKYKKCCLKKDEAQLK